MRLILLIALIALAPTFSPALAAEPIGIWLTADKRAKIEIAPCGAAYCGTLIWVAGNDTDSHSPDVEQRGRLTLGQQILLGMHRSGSSYRGTVHNLENGRTYRGRLDVLDERRIRLSRCILAGLICRSDVWTRAE